MKKIWRIDQAFKGVSIKENELAIGLGHRKYPGYDKMNFIAEIRELGVKPHSSIVYTPNPLKASRAYCLVTDNYFKLRFIWLLFLLWLFRYKSVAILLEPLEIKPWAYSFIKKYHYLFYAIVTHDKEILKKHEVKCIFLPIAAPTLMPEKLDISNRKILCTYLYNSRKAMTEGHLIRKNFAEIAQMHEANCKILNTKFGLDKADFMFNTHFAIIIQNSRKDWYFSDMLLDCFACGVIPIYYGSKGYKHFFEAGGVVEIDDLSSLEAILSKLTVQDYIDRVDFVKSNFLKVKEFYDVDCLLINKIENYILKRNR
tara:strand:- start:2478 stop:3416 length:939 start_codon:yes stop_codon:yes gene_type:complete